MLLNLGWCFYVWRPAPAEFGDREGGIESTKRDTDTITWCPLLTAQEAVFYVYIQTHHKLLHTCLIVLFLTS